MSQIESVPSGAIRLTNRTARALRRCAQRERGVCRAAVILLTAALCVMAVLLGIRWLPAVPLVIAGTLLLDALLLSLGRSRYFALIGQAICTEAAARGMQDQSAEKRRRRQALSDLADIHEDMMRMAREEAAEDDDLLPPLDDRVKPEGVLQPDQPEEEDTRRVEPVKSPTRRRRRQAAFQVIHGEENPTSGGPSGDTTEWRRKARH